MFVGAVNLALGWACWKTYLGRPQTDVSHQQAMSTLARALRYDGEDPDAALSVLRIELEELRRFWPRDTEAKLAAMTNIAGCYTQMHRDDKALRIYRTTHAGYSDFFGPTHQRSLEISSNLCASLIDNGLFAEAKKLARDELCVVRRTMGERHVLSIDYKFCLASALYRDPDALRADVIEGEALLVDAKAMASRVLGGQHPRTLNIGSHLEFARRHLSPVLDEV